MPGNPPYPEDISVPDRNKAQLITDVVVHYKFKLESLPAGFASPEREFRPLPGKPAGKPSRCLLSPS
ncbi:MAG: hypothetical protein WCN95_15700, partial [bacterium]